MDYNILIFLNLVCLLLLFFLIRKKTKVLVISLLLFLALVTTIDIISYKDLNFIPKNYLDYESAIASQRHDARSERYSHLFEIRDNIPLKDTEEAIKKGSYVAVEINYFLYTQYLAGAKYSQSYYYQLCMFFENNSCVNIKKNTGRNHYNMQKSNNWYLKSFYIPLSYEDVVIYNYASVKDIVLEHIKTQDNACEILMYGAQNGWDSYRQELVNQLEKNLNCIISLNKKFNFNNSQYIQQLNDDFILFLKNQDIENYDGQFELGLISMKELNQHKEKSYYKNLLDFLYDDKQLDRKEQNIIQLHYVLSSSHQKELLPLLNEDKVDEIIKVFNKYLGYNHEDIDGRLIEAITEVILFTNKSINKLFDL